MLSSLGFTQEAEGPFPWSKRLTEAAKSQDSPECRRQATLISNYMKLMTGEPPVRVRPIKLQQYENQTDTVSVPVCTPDCETVACISYKLPAAGVTPGKVLQHCSRQLEKLFHEKGPLIFKIGYTHDAIWRWTNAIYGYIHDADGWTDMMILYATDEPYGPGMLEACLIDKFASRSFELSCWLDHLWPSLFLSFFAFSLPPSLSLSLALSLSLSPSVPPSPPFSLSLSLSHSLSLSLTHSLSLTLSRSLSLTHSLTLLLSPCVSLSLYNPCVCVMCTDVHPRQAWMSKCQIGRRYHELGAVYLAEQIYDICSVQVSAKASHMQAAIKALQLWCASDKTVCLTACMGLLPHVRAV